MGKRHYLSKTKEYRIWVNLRYYYRDEICEQWKSSPIDFVSYIQRLSFCGAKGYTLCKIRKTGDFEPGNIHFIKRSFRNASRNFGKIVGVRKRGRKFVARIIVNKAEHTIGSADTAEEALAMRNEYITINRLPHKIQ